MPRANASSHFESGHYIFRHRSCDLKGRLVEDGMLVMAGSSARADPRPGAPRTILNRRAQLLADGVAEINGDRFVLMQDYLFAGPGQAVDLMNGGHVRDPLRLWRDSHGTSMFDSRAKN